MVFQGSKFAVMGDGACWLHFAEEHVEVTQMQSFEKVVAELEELMALAAVR